MKLSTTQASALALLILMVTIASPATALEPSGVVLRGVTVFDGSGAAPRPGLAIRVDSGRIAEIGPEAEIVTPEGIPELDLAGRFVLPGFIDLHVHLPPQESVHPAMLDRFLEFGVTTVLSPGARKEAGLGVRRRIEAGELRGPRFLTAGPSLDGLNPGASSGGSILVDSERAIRQAVRAQVEDGVDWIKLYRRLRPEVVAAAIDEAHLSKVPVAGHMGETTWRQAAEYGIDMLVHLGWGSPMDEVVDLEDPASATDADWYAAYGRAENGDRFRSLAALLAEKEVVVVPTVAIQQAAGLGKDATLLPRFRPDLAPEADLPGWWGEGWRQRHPQYAPDDETEARLLEEHYMKGVLGTLRGLWRVGVRLGVGTDVGNEWIAPGHSFHYELELYEEAGIPRLEILRMATSAGAEALGLENEIGTLRPGLAADLLVLSRDPTLAIANTRSIERAMLRGRWVVASGPFLRPR